MFSSRNERPYILSAETERVIIERRALAISGGYNILYSIMLRVKGICSKGFISLAGSIIIIYIVIIIIIVACPANLAVVVLAIVRD